MGFGEVIDKAVCFGLTLSAYVGGLAGCKCTVSGVTLPTALTTQGPVRGFTDTHGNSVFLGIPFAATTGGANRYVMLPTAQTSTPPL
jgi:hypothetical protein